MGDIIRGTTSLSSMYRGSTEIQKVYRGSTEIWASVPPLNWSQSDNGMVYGAWKPPTASATDGGVSNMAEDWTVQLRVVGSRSGQTQEWGEVLNLAGGEILPAGRPIRMQGTISTSIGFDNRSRYEVEMVSTPGYRTGYSYETWPYYASSLPSSQTLFKLENLNTSKFANFDEVVTINSTGQVGFIVRSNRPYSSGSTNQINLTISNLTFTNPE